MLALALLWITRAQAQDSLPFTINAAGGHSEVSGQLYDFNFGEMTVVNTFSTGSYLLTQGFLQPYLITINFNTATDVFVENNMMTPNGDGKNDAFVIQGIDKYPGNKLSIFDRAGRKLYSATNYQNNWNAHFDGKPLSEDTYYYILELGQNKALIRGFISIISDKR